MKRLLVGLLLASAGATAHASDTVLYQPIPSWVKPAPSIDAAAATDEHAPATVVFDSQTKLEDGQVWSYVDSATRVVTAQMLGQIGTVKLSWNPSHGDLIIHKLEILRGAQHIDLVKGGNPFTVLRREEMIDQRQLDGMLTATLPVAGLAVGDVLHLVMSTTEKDPTLKGDLQMVAPLVSVPARAGFARTRIIWPVGSDIHWRAYSAGVDATPVVVNGYRDLTIALPLAKQPEIPDDAPMRFQKLPLIEATSFDSWDSVVDVMAPLYRTDGLIAANSPLAAEIAKIKAAAADPVHRTALALQLVQDKVRYLAINMDTGNYVPQTPAHSWDVRYGDCKAKTLLLLAILHELGIEAVPVLANIGLGGLVSSRLPAATAFNHIFVRATIGGRDYWLDGTGMGSRLVDINDVPAFGTVLPLVGSAALVTLPKRANGRPDVTVALDLDNSVALKLPTLFHLRLEAHGAQAEAMNVVVSQAVGEQRDEFIQGVVRQTVGEAQLDTSSLAYDAATSTVVLQAGGVIQTKWQRDDRRLRQDLDGILSSIDFTPDRARPEWREIPVLGVRNISLARHVTIELPSDAKNYAIEGDRTLPAELAGAALARTVTTSGNRIVVDERIDGLGEEIAPAHVGQVRAEVAQVKGRGLRASAPADYPGYYFDLAAAKRTKKLAPYEAVYSKAIANDQKEPTSWQSRANFRAGVFDWQGSIEDYTKAIALRPSASLYLFRAASYRALGQDAKQLADIDAAADLDPSSDAALLQQIGYKTDHGDTAGAITQAQRRIDLGGATSPSFKIAKASAQAAGTHVADAIDTLDAAVAETPGNPSLLNARCWLKGTYNTALDSALKDCTKSIELSEYSAAALDSRAMIYYRMQRYDDALADLSAAIDESGGQMSSVFMRGIIRQRQGKTREAADDFALVKLVSPQTPKEYARYGITP